MGLGAIGSAVARKMNALGMRVIATRLHPEMKPDYVEWVGAPDAFPELLRESDVLVLSAPATEATKGLIDEAALRAMKPTSYVIKPGRPQCDRGERPSLAHSTKVGSPAPRPTCSTGARASSATTRPCGTRRTSS